MASTSVDILEDIAPEMAALSTATKEQFLSYAASMHTASFFGNSYALAMAYCAAHLMTEAGLGSGSSGAAAASAASAGLSGPVTSQKTGDVAQTYANVAQNAQTAEQAWWMTTKYGRAYLGLRKRKPGSAPGLVRAGGVRLSDPLNGRGLT